MKTYKRAIVAAMLAGFAMGTTAKAADVPAPAKPKPSNTVSLEYSPEYKTTDSTLVDDYLKFGYSHSFDNNFVFGSSMLHVWRVDKTSAEQADASLGYKIKMDKITLTPSATLGYGFGEKPGINHADKFAPEAYFALSLAGDLKLDDHWTWNAFNMRYRNAFDTTWYTPKISTGITYRFDGTSAIYANFGYGWKDAGDGKGFNGDKWNLAVGYKFSF